MPFELDPADSWQPYVYGDTPEDAVTTLRQSNDTLRRWTRGFAFVSKIATTSDHAELFWNGSTWVALADSGIDPTGGSGVIAQAPTGALALSQVTYSDWQTTIPWSQIGSGCYSVRFYATGTSGTKYDAIKPVQISRYDIKGPKQANPEGIAGVDSSFGGTDALRVVDADGNGIAGVVVTAFVTPEGNNIVYQRATALTGSDGRWAFDVVLQPNTLHTLKFSKRGYTFPTTTTITTGANS